MNSKLLTLISLLCVSIPISMTLLWIDVFNKFSTHSERLQQYFSYFPEFMATRNSSAVVSLLFAVLAIVFTSLSLKKSDRFLSIINVLILILGISVLALNLWGIM